MESKTTSSHKSAEPENSVLYIVGTPIGNLNDISLRALNILKNASLIACEDTRQTKKIMSKYEISNKLISFNEHNSKIKIPKIICYQTIYLMEELLYFLDQFFLILMIGLIWNRKIMNFLIYQEILVICNRLQFYQ